MKTHLLIPVLLVSLSTQLSGAVHLVMLGGDERIEKLDVDTEFLPALKKSLGKEVVVVKTAYTRTGIQHWYRDWKRPSLKGAEMVDLSRGWIFDELTQNVRAAVQQQPVKSITLAWVHGEADAMGGESVYAQSFRGLLQQFRNEFGREDLNYVIARLGKEPSRKQQAGWDEMRSIQVQLADDSSRGAWLDTDDLKNDALGESLAKATRDLILANPSTPASLEAPSPAKKRPAAHLIMLSGQSNMALLDPTEAFVPTVRTAFGKDGVIVVKAAYGAKRISHWFKTKESDPRNWLYRELIGKARQEIRDREIETITLVWMQGESDASTSDNATAYAENFHGLLNLLRKDLGREDIHYVIGRLSDHSNPKKFPEWETMRATQIQLADASPIGAWIDTDDLNGEKDDLHYPKGKSGKIPLAERFAAKTIELIRENE